MTTGDDWRTDRTRALFEAILTLEDIDEAAGFFRDLCTLAEIEAMSQRWQIVLLLDEGLPYREIAEQTGAFDGHRHPDQPVAPPRGGRLPPGARSASGAPDGPPRVAVPNKGRLLEPTERLLRDAGLAVRTGRSRALTVPVRNVPIELMFVRTEDVAEMVADGVAGAGITGLDLVEESGADLVVVAELGFGQCRLTAAVANSSPVGEAGGPDRAAGSPPPTPR